MDRLPAVARAAAVAAAGALLLSCGGGGEAPRRSRVEGVKAVATPDVGRFCEATWARGAGPLLSLPKVEPARPGATVPALPRGRWVWVNLWATWCVPCRREMPLLLQLADRLHTDGVDVELWFVSIDENGDELSRFLAANPVVAPEPSVRAASRDGFRTWMTGYTTAESSSIPINLVAAPDGRARCLRVGSLREGDYPVVKAVFTP